MFHDCPREGQNVYLYVGPSINMIFLYKTFHVSDWKGNQLKTTLSRTVFSRCECSGPQEEEVEATATDEFGNEAECLFTVSIIDNIPPVIRYCPKRQTMNENDNIVWTAPTIRDNVGLETLYTPNQYNNTKFLPGLYTLIYNATDYSGNSEICRFQIRVYSTDYYVKYKKSTDPSMVISSAIVGVLFITLIVMALAMYRLCKKRRQLNSTGGRPNSQVTRSATTQGETHDNPVFTIYNNDPPPYDIATYDKLPDYSPPIFPPSYEEVQSSTQINLGEDNLVCSITESSTEEPDEGSSPSQMIVDYSQESNTGKHVNTVSKTTENNTSVQQSLQQSLQRDLHPTVHGNMQLDHVNLQINSNSIQTDI
ncbi:uncharacterized protein LOC127724711 [Mytilus californianus]|uniref:uncharacterized protein LOC127724711 n=1 Tax=Mytilus californianus TaxID=6549 RepID=UPI0022472807|nr:uncharacterized protein LOC127724711 [Mytilus californianus]